MGKIKLVHSQIMKNESHVIERMLNSIKPIVDEVVLVDTGSTDNTIEVCNKWGIDNNIPVHIFERPFDNFQDCRNFALSKTKEVMSKENDLNDVYFFWLDADEIMIIDPKFDKQKMDKDLYMLNTNIGSMRYTRNEVGRLSKPFKWYGVCHEFIVCDDPNITSGLLDGLNVNVFLDGASWKDGKTSEKYKGHAFVLEKYIDSDRSDPRWIFYTAQSYHDSATVPNNREENEERIRRAIRYYKERVSRTDGYEEERFYSQYRVGSMMRMLEEPWRDTMQELMKAYSMDSLRGEPIKLIIDHYLSVGEFQLAYLYSKFAKVNFHGKNPYPNRLLFVDETLYNWKFLEVHIASSYYTNRRDEARSCFQELLQLTKSKPNWFSPEDVVKINSNANFLK